MEENSGIGEQLDQEGSYTYQIKALPVITVPQAIDPNPAQSGPRCRPQRKAGKKTLDALMATMELLDMSQVVHKQDHVFALEQEKDDENQLSPHFADAPEFTFKVDQIVDEVKLLGLFTAVREK